MTDGDALLRAILANKADDTPRLVYADWLEENRQEERAEFIRVQVELARGGCGCTYSSHNRRSTCNLCARERELWFLQCARQWFDLSDVFGVRGWLHKEPGCVSWDRIEHYVTIRRGFISHITCTAADWLRNGRDLGKRHPIERVSLDDDSDHVDREYLQTTWPEIEFDLLNDVEVSPTVMYMGFAHQ